MRVHEFSKKHALESKQVLEALKKEGFDVKSHMSVLPEEAVKFLEKTFIKKQNKPQAPKQSKTQEQEVSSMALKTRYVPNSKRKNYSEAAKETITSFAENREEQSVRPVIEPLEAKAMLLSDFAEKVEVPANEVILTLLKQGKPCAKNQLLPLSLVRDLCEHYGVETTRPATEKPKNVLGGKLSLSDKNVKPRPPVVVVMGHVDHGKTTLLDFIKKTRVASREKGGITQHLGAYEVDSGHGKIVFLDTPGHEAFSKIRKRGASVADVAVLVVAADDGIMPQTVECIKAIKALAIPFVVAINKVDRVDEKRIEIVKRQLSQYDLLVEDWGGDVVSVPLSAKEGQGVDKLLEMIALQAEMLELKASLVAPVKGYVLESKMLKGRGSVATVLTQQGTLHVGDFFVAGAVVGKVTSLSDSSGKALKSVGPAVPVLVTGFSVLPDVGAVFGVISEQEYRKLRSSVSSEGSQFSSVLSQMAGEQKINIILKADTNSSLEAIVDAFGNFPEKEIKKIVLVRASAGDITESDTLLAESTQSILVGFNVKAEHNAVLYARRINLSIDLFGVIYKLLEEVEKLAAKDAVYKTVLTKTGQATVLKVFKIKKLGVIAGCVVNEGSFSGKGIVAVIRNKEEIARGKIKSLQRDKKTVKEVHEGFECAFIVDGFEGWEEGDIAVCYLSTSKAS